MDIALWNEWKTSPNGFDAGVSFDEYVAAKNQTSHKVLFAVKIGEEDWEEQLITEVESRIEAASKWAKDNGFDRLRVATIDDTPPDFVATIRRG